MFPIDIFSKRLANIRKTNNVSAREVAESIGVSKAAISQFESGKNAPSAAVLISLADYFDVSIDCLVGRSEDLLNGGLFMASDLPRYTLRMQKEYLEKIRYIAEENGRSANREIEIMIKQRISDYEREHGEIKLEP